MPLRAKPKLKQKSQEAPIMTRKQIRQQSQAMLHKWDNPPTGLSADIIKTQSLPKSIQDRQNSGKRQTNKDRKNSQSTQKLKLRSSSNKKENTRKVMDMQQQQERELDEQQSPIYNSKSMDIEDDQPSLLEPQPQIVNVMIPKIIKCLDECFVSQQLIIPCNQIYQIEVQSLLGLANIFQGCSSVGKTTAVRYIIKCKNQRQSKKRSHLVQRYHLITIDCLIYQTQMQFLMKLIQEVQEVLEILFEKRQIVGGDIDLKQLNEEIIKSKRKFIILVRNAETLTLPKKQLLLYNLLEWIRTDVMDSVGVIFSSNCLNLSDRFQKRVRSRFNGKTFWFLHPTQTDIIKILGKRIQHSDIQTAIKIKLKNALLKQNSKKLQKSMKSKQDGLPRGVEHYLKSFKLIFAHLNDQFLRKSTPQQLGQELAEIFQRVQVYVPPHDSKINTMIQSCSYPEIILLCLIRHMMLVERYPIKLKKVNEVYCQFKKRLQGDNSKTGENISVSFKEPTLERALRNIQELGLVKLDNIRESIWIKQIISLVDPEEIQFSVKTIPHLHRFILNILND